MIQFSDLNLDCPFEENIGVIMSLPEQLSNEPTTCFLKCIEKDESCDNNHSKRIIVQKIIHSYTILAPQREGKFVDAKQSTAAVLTTIQLDENDYRLGHTKARKSSNPTYHLESFSFS